MTSMALLIPAMVLDAVIGDPARLWQKLPHPAALMGRAVAVLERRLNHGGNRRAKGVAALVLLLAGAGLAGFVLAALPGGWLIEIVLAAILLAQNSLVSHVGAVARALERGLDPGREAVALIVGRDVAALDEDGIVRSAIESLAENFSDGVIAPACWFLVFGLPGIMIYKMANTADSMIGYRTERYAQFGWAAARFDDLANWLPARLTGLLICLAHGSAHAVTVMRRDARLHRSPNAGWPEAATAAVTGVAISGPRVYHGQPVDYPFVHAEGRRALIANDIDQAIRAIWRSWALALGLLIAALILL
ncbi:MAG: adenosylcobinamide-phosphate synthase CbiB [Rhodobacteraceae bacterium]|nr:adenosylcobinamide-phosphate synthase CbiB [Paracoccaceae bacterium]